MRKIFALLTLLLIFTLQSCSTNIDLTLHKDETMSGKMEIDFVKLLEESKKQGLDPAILQSTITPLPSKDWVSIYDFSKNSKEINPKELDSLQILKRVYVKGIYTGTAQTAAHIKFEKILPSDLRNFLYKSNKDDKLVSTLLPVSWSKKTAELDLSYYNQLVKLFNNDEKDEQDESEIKTLVSNITATMAQQSTLKSRIRFETKIKNIKGQHDWVKKLDDYTVEILPQFNDSTKGEKPLKKYDSKITITTE